MIRTLRKKVLARTVAVFFLTIFVQSLFPQQYLYALTTGPHQVEHTSYESPGATDMVNLSTGDFSFNLPILEVPGPEAGFSLPLTYNAGIGLDQESSWTGLGWNINPGSITRNINGFPDDANGEWQSVSVKDLTGLHGWDMSLFGLGNFGWNSQNGHYGSLSLLSIVNASWDGNGNSVGIVGVNVSSGGVTLDAGQMAMGVVGLASVGASGVANSGKALTWSAATAAKSSALQLAIQSSISEAASLSSSGSPSPSGGYWKYSKRETGVYTPLGSFKKYKVWLDQTRLENMYGILYLGNAPLTAYNDDNGNLFDVRLKNGGTSETLYRFTKTEEGAVNQGAASDINFETSETSAYYDFQTPSLLATDNFSVKFRGISGSIAPYRLEVGSVGVPREMTSKHVRLAPVPYLPNNGTGNAYKVPFVYEGASNAYFHHVGSSTAVTSPTFYYGIGTSIETSGNNTLTYELNDIALKNERIKNSVTLAKKIPQHNYVEWLSNSEIKASMTYSSKYIDFLSGGSGTTVADTSARHRFRNRERVTGTTSSTNSFNSAAIPFTDPDFYSAIAPSGAIVSVMLDIYASQSDLENGIASDHVGASGTVNSVANNSGLYSFSITNPILTAQHGKIVDIKLRLLDGGPRSPWGIGFPNVLGAFCITGVDGSTYHFGLPLYDDAQYTYIENVGDANKNTAIERLNAFANTWLLTAITGPDFIDRNSNGLADEGDWGHWVKLNYGVHTSEYKWRLPYNDYLRSPDNLMQSYTEGKKQLIYLNSIETRSHVALFKKSLRSDGKDKSITSVYPLKLDEIILLTQEHYKKLTTSSSSGGYDLPTFTNRIDRLLMASSITAGAQTFIEKNAVKRIQFVYSYDLCPGTLNSDAAGAGKLTLTKIATLGRNNVKLVPDYKFEYGYNPSYDKNLWDGFGMYSTTGGTSGTSHDVNESTADQSGLAWSLSKLTTPIGGEILVNYERDQYSSVSGKRVLQSVNFGNSNYNVYYPGGGVNQNGDTYNQITLGSTSGFSVGDIVEITGTINFKCYNAPSYITNSYSGIYTITAINGTKVTVNGDFLGVSTCGSSGSAIHVDYNSASIGKILSKKGGDIRVGSIVVKDEFGNQDKIKYLYKNQDGTSSGCLSKQADYTNSGVNITTPLGYPSTPVIYGTVSVLSGKLTDDNDYHSKQVYEFYVPNLQDYTIASENIKIKEAHVSGFYYDFLTLVNWKIEDKTSRVGALKSVSLYNKNNVLYSSSQLTYTDQTVSPILNSGVNNYHGVFSSGTIMAERVRDNSSIAALHRATRTTVLKYPHQVKKIVNSKDGFTSESTNLSWDLITGAVDQKLDRSSMGIYVKTVSKPAYSAYSEMGSKAVNANNRNMLSQIAATYVYKSDATGSNLGLIAAEAHTWRKNWSNYRYYNGTDYADDPTSSSYPVWRKAATYAWKGAYNLLRADGTHTFNPTTNEFNFAAPASNANWQYLDETKRYDHFSMALEAKGRDSTYAAVKMGYDNRLKIAEASNARFSEIAFTSAEDVINGVPFFGGEVAVGSGTVLYKSKGDFTLVNTGDVNINGPHTGEAAIVVNATKAFIYKPTSLTLNSTYRASVWTNSTNGRVYYKLNGGAEVTSPAGTTAMKAGKWYLVHFEIPVGSTFTSLEVGVKSIGGKVVFDDFRFQPADAVMTCYVYNPLSFEFSGDFNTYTYVLDNDNFFTLYQESGDGLLTKVYQESITHGGTEGYRLISETKSNYRRFNINP
jgi:hypothetical protein